MSQPPATPAAPSPAPAGAVPRGARSWLALWFGLRAPVTPAAYRNTGFALMLVKYLLDASIIYAASGRLWQPWDYLSPLMATRKALPEPVAVVLVLLTLPFLWVGVSMTARRARNAGVSTGLGVALFFVPFINYLWMVWLCVLPQREGSPWARPDQQHALSPAWRSVLLGVALSTVVGVSMVVVSVTVLESYGAGLFVGSPFLTGALCGYLFNKDVQRGVRETLGVTTVSVLVTAGAIVLFALEGVVCLAMAAPVAMVMAGLGGVLGRALAAHGPPQALVWLFMGLGLPWLTGMERLAQAPVERAVVTVVEINAPPEVVWPFVVGHSDLPPPTEWFFRLGIAYPVGSATFGAGLGATRYCTFSTGALVESITAWEPGRRLAFVALSQPAPMRELTPYDIQPPHLDGYVRSVAGEFVLEPLEGDRTRLTGTTWYRSSLYPETYWALWSDALVRAVHQRVFNHIARLAQGPAATH